MDNQDNQTNWWNLDTLQVCDKLQTQISGLDSEQVIERELLYGRNELPEDPPETWISLFIKQFNSPLLYILIIAAGIALFLREYIDGLVIIGVLFLNGVVGAFQEGKAQRALIALRDYTETETIVIRDGIPIELKSIYLVPGDIIKLYPGDIIPSDVRLLEAESVRVDEASLTGESLPVEKYVDVINGKNIPIVEQKNMLFKGTFIVDGVAKAVVVTTGVNTVIGHISKKIAGINTEIPLQKNITSLSKIIIIATIGIIIALGIFGLLAGYEWKEILLIMSSLLVSVIPEGLPIVMTLILAIGVSRMAKRNALVKKLQAVEGLAHTTVIAVDKTGTLTRNELMVEEVYVDDNKYTVSGEGYIPDGTLQRQGKSVVFSSEIGFEYAAYLSVLSASAEIIEYEGRYTISGDPTEGALLVLGSKAGYDKKQSAKESPILYKIPFNTRDKYYVNTRLVDGVPAMIVAGAPEVILKHCSEVWHAEGKTFMSSDEKKRIEIEIEEMAQRGLRVVMLAVRTENVSIHKKDCDISQLRFVSLFGMRDSLRSEVPEAVAKTQHAGMHVVMITGDHKMTAQSIAYKAGIYREDDLIVTGEELDDMSENNLTQILGKVTVFARVTPDHKLRIVEAYKNKGDIIAMTGDGVNDVPPLVAAHLGFAMGTVGTEVAKESAEIVLLDDNFATITAAIEEGRHIFNTLKKVLIYLFSTNLGELLLIVAAMVLLLPVPLSPVQLIWINLVTDTFLVLALAFEPMEKNILSIPFKKPTKYLIDKGGLIQLIVFGIIIAMGTFGVFYYYQHDLELARTITLVTLGFYELFRLWSIRTEKTSCFSKSPIRSPWLLAGSILVLILQVAIIYLPFMQEIFDTVPLSLSQWGIAMLVASTIIIADELRKLFTWIYTKKVS